MQFDMNKMACFGVAGNFTGHLEQAGEAVDFLKVATTEENEPKALFPTYIPKASEGCPAFLNVFPFDADSIVYPENQTKLQIEPECGIVFSVKWENGNVTDLTPVCFGASNDCSIRREGAKKISLKKNWGSSSKGFSNQRIEIHTFDESSILNDYKIASFLVRGNDIYPYGEDSFVRDYSYVYQKLTNWLIKKLNEQKDVGPAEEISVYLKGADYPAEIFVSIGATRYTEFGETNFLQVGDHSIVALYPASKYSFDDIVELVKNKDYSKEDISVLDQVIMN